MTASLTRAIHAHPPESHADIGTTGWLRPFVLGAEDGIVSTSALLIGVAAAGGTTHALIAAGSAGLMAGALSMAAGEYVSVAAQRDTENADIAREKWELANLPEAELDELTGIYEQRGLDQRLARDVATALTRNDALAAHLRDELAIDQRVVARPWQAAWLSASSFAIGAILPLLAMLLAPMNWRVTATVLATVVTLGGAGALGARIGRSHVLSGTARVLAGGSLAMAVTWGIGRLLGVSLG
jgi:VIT1/CCC1 family predicted Fe2+/Mn2+ transporter